MTDPGSWVETRYATECKGCSVEIAANIRGRTKENRADDRRYIRCADPDCQSINLAEPVATKATTAPRRSR